MSPGKPILPFPVDAIAPDLLTCKGSGPWEGFRDFLERAVHAPSTTQHVSPRRLHLGGRAYASPQWLGCAFGDDPEEERTWTPHHLGKLFRRAAELVNHYAWVAKYLIKNPQRLFAACLAPTTLASFCFTGYFNAFAVLMRIVLDLRAGRCAATALAAMEEVRTTSEVAAEWLEDAFVFAQAETLLTYLRHPTIPLLFIDSSGWPFRLSNISGLLAEVTGERQYGQWRAPMGGGWWKLTPRASDAVSSFGWRSPMPLRVWSMSLHATLAMEPESIWTDVISAGSPWDITVESVFMSNYCNVGGLGRCTTHGRLSDLMKRHVIKSAPAVNGVNKFPHIPDPDGLRRDFLELALGDAGIQAADILLCSEPAFFCTMFPTLGKPIFAYIGNPFGAYLLPSEPQEAFYSDFYDVMAAGVSTAACVSTHLEALVYWHSGVRCPRVTPLGLYTRATYRPTSKDVLVSKQMFLAWDVVCVLNQFVDQLLAVEAVAGTRMRDRRHNSTRFVRVTDLRDRSWRNWARHWAAVVLPYDPQQLVFYELYGMNLPLLVPGEALLPYFTRLGYTNLREFNHQRPGWSVPRGELNFHWSETAAVWELRWWSALTGFSELPHLLRWESAPELLALLFHADLEEVAARMRLEAQARLLYSADFWRAAFARAFQ